MKVDEMDRRMEVKAIGPLTKIMREEEKVK